MSAIGARHVPCILLVTLLTLAVGLLTLRLYYVLPVLEFNEMVYPGLAESEVEHRMGHASRRLDTEQRELLTGGNYRPAPHIPIQDHVLIYYKGIYRFSVYVGKDARVQCVVTGRT